MRKTTAIILAAGKGTRMNIDTDKQFLPIKGKPVVCYSIAAFESSNVDDIILVASDDNIEYCKKEIVDKYGFKKISKIVSGGKERYNSVYNAINNIEETDYVLIHDSARPMIKTNQINAVIEDVMKYKACVMAVNVKDTIKISDDSGFVSETPNRNTLWQIQTPQAFEFELIKSAYIHIIENEIGYITDDAMAVEIYTGGKQKIRLTKGSYENIKITTMEDLIFAEKFLDKIM